MNFFFSSRRRHTFFFQAEDGIRDRSPSRGLGDVYKRQHWTPVERESGAALIKAVEWAAQGEEGDIGTAISESYPGIQVSFSR